MSESSQNALTSLSEWYDKQNAHRDPEALTWARISKITEEVGEVNSAFIGVLGSNPRKGITHSMKDVESELLDVAITALAALEHVRGNDGSSLESLDQALLTGAKKAGLL